MRHATYGLVKQQTGARRTGQGQKNGTGSEESVCLSVLGVAKIKKVGLWGVTTPLHLMLFGSLQRDYSRRFDLARAVRPLWVSPVTFRPPTCTPSVPGFFFLRVLGGKGPRQLATGYAKLLYNIYGMVIGETSFLFFFSAFSFCAPALPCPETALSLQVHQYTPPSPLKPP